MTPEEKAMMPEGFDKLLSEALEAGAPPPDGLEPRILAAVAAGTAVVAARRRPRRFAWGGAAAGAAAVALALWAGMPRLVTAPPARAQAATGPLEVGAGGVGRAFLPARRGASRPAARPAMMARRVMVARRERHWPAVFPSPAPPTPEERALMAFVRSAPPRLLAAALSFPEPKWLDAGPGQPQTAPNEAAPDSGRQGEDDELFPQFPHEPFAEPAGGAGAKRSDLGAEASALSGP